MNITKLLVAVVLVVIPIASYSNDYLVINGVSKHVGSSKHYNESNYGFGYAWDAEWESFGKIQPQVGWYDNSNDDLVAYVTATKYFSSVFNRAVRFGILGGVVVGYQQFPILPTAAFVINGRTEDDVDINFMFTGYSDQGTIKPLIGIQFIVPFNYPEKLR